MPGGTYRVMGQAKLRSGGTITHTLGWVKMKAASDAIAFASAMSASSAQVSGAVHVYGWSSRTNLAAKAKLKLKSRSTGKTYTVKVGRNGKFSKRLKGLRPGSQLILVTWPGSKQAAGFEVWLRFATVMKV